MKKLIFTLFTVLLIIGVSPSTKVSAIIPPTFVIGEDIHFICNTTYIEDAVEGFMYFGESATEVTISLPENPATIKDNGSHILKILFYDDTDAIVYGFNVDEIFGPEFEGAYDYYINFATLDIPSDAVYLKYTIPMNVGVPCDITTEDYYNDNSSSTIGYTQIPYGRFGWNFLENTATSYPDDIFSYDWLVSTIIEIPTDTRYLNLDKGSHQIRTQVMTYYSTIEFFDDVGASIDVYNLSEFPTDNIYISHSFDIDLTLLDNYIDIVSFQISEVFTIITPDLILQNNVFFTYNFDFAVLPIVNFWVDDVIDFTRISHIGTFVSYSGGFPSKVGSDFVDWVYHDNTPYRYPDALSSDYLVNGEINLYAIFRVIPVDLVGTVDDFVTDEDSTFTVAMTSLGFNDPIERTIVFGFVVILTSLVLLFKGVSNIAILIVVACELLFFMYLGVLPLFASIIIGLVLILIGFSALGGGSNE